MGKKAVFIGLTNLDYVYYVKHMPEENAKCRTFDYARYVGGPAANAAITYSLLGGDATLITAYGNSPESRIIDDALQAFGVKSVNLSQEGLPGISTICVSENGARTIVSGQTAYRACKKELLAETVSDAFLKQFDFALSDCNQEDIAFPILNRLTCDVVLDAGSFKEHTEEFLKRASIVISSERFRDTEGRDIFSMPYGTIRHRAMTRGEKKILTEKGEIAVSSVQCVDSLAAGDVFHGAFCFYYYEKNVGFAEALQEAAVIASQSVRYRGPRAWSQRKE